MATVEMIRRRLVPLVQEGVITDPAVAQASAGSEREVFTVAIRVAKTTKLPAARIEQMVREAAADLDVDLVLNFVA